MASGLRMLAQDRVRWAPVWSESRGRSHGLSEDSAQRNLDQPGPESRCYLWAKVKKVRPRPLMIWERTNGGSVSRRS